MGQVTKVCLSCYLVLLSFDRKKKQVTRQALLRDLTHVNLSSLFLQLYVNLERGLPIWLFCVKNITYRSDIFTSVAEIWLLQNLTLKWKDKFMVKVQSHIYIQCIYIYNGANFLLTDIPSFPCQSTLPFLRCSYFKI